MDPSACITGAQSGACFQLARGGRLHMAARCRIGRRCFPIGRCVACTVLFFGHGGERPWAPELVESSQDRLQVCPTLLAHPFTRLQESEGELWGSQDQLSVSGAQERVSPLHLFTAPLQLLEPVTQLWEPHFYL